jgi:hypothetical protein
MSRYHSVRPKNPSHQQPKPGAAPLPSEAQIEQAAIERLEKATSELYKLRHGDTIDAAIARTNRLLAIHDREAEKVVADEPVGGYRWTVSPAICVRLETQLAALEARRDKLMEECWQEARQIVAQFMRDHVPTGDPLCPPKQAGPATQADPQPTPAKGAPPQSGQIAA